MPSRGGGGRRVRRDEVLTARPPRRGRPPSRSRNEPDREHRRTDDGERQVVVIGSRPKPSPAIDERAGEARTRRGRRLRPCPGLEVEGLDLRGSSADAETEWAEGSGMSVPQEPREEEGETRSALRNVPMSVARTGMANMSREGDEGWRGIVAAQARGLGLAPMLGQADPLRGADDAADVGPEPCRLEPNRTHCTEYDLRDEDELDDQGGPGRSRLDDAAVEQREALGAVIISTSAEEGESGGVAVRPSAGGAPRGAAGSSSRGRRRGAAGLGRGGCRR